MNPPLGPICATLIPHWYEIYYSMYSSTPVASPQPILVINARAGAVHSHGRWWFIRVHSSSSLCEDESDRYEEGKEWETARRMRDRHRLPEAMRRLNSISLWKICSTRQITPLKKVFIAVWQWGPRAVTWLHSRVWLFVFIMWRAAMSAPDDLFFPLSACRSHSLSANIKW